MTKFSENIRLFLLLSVVLASSLAYSFYFKIPPAVDARAYDSIAWNIVQGNGYRETLDTPLIFDNAIIRVGPGYEFFLAAIYYIFGHHYWPVWVFQALLMVFAGYLVFLISKTIFQDHWNFYLGFTAAALIGLSPDLITMQGMLMTETLGIFLIIATMYLFFIYLDDKSLLSVMFLGVVSGAAVMVRTPAVFLLFPILAYFISHKFWKHVVVFLISSALLFVPWIWRNYQVYGLFVPTNAAGGFNLTVGNHLGATGEQEPYPPLDSLVERFGAFKTSTIATKEAMNFVMRNPIEFIRLTILRTSIYFSFARPTGFWFHLHGLSKAITLATSSIYSMLLFVFGFIGIFQIKDLVPQETNKARWLLFMLVMMPLSVIGIVVETRYRMLVYPFFAIFAGYGLMQLWNKKLKLLPTFLVVLTLFLNTGFDALRNIGRIIAKIHGI